MESRQLHYSKTFTFSRAHEAWMDHGTPFPRDQKGVLGDNREMFAKRCHCSLAPFPPSIGRLMYQNGRLQGKLSGDVRKK